MKKVFCTCFALIFVLTCFSMVASADNERQYQHTYGETRSFLDLLPVANGQIRADYAPKDFVEAYDPLADYVPSSMDFLTDQMVTRSITRKVNVTQPCDQDWREEYPSNWMWQAKRIVVESDRIYERVIGVQFVSHSQKSWNRKATNWIAQLDEVIRDWGLRGANMMMAFSGTKPGPMGAAYMNSPYAIIWDYGYDANWGVGQHETGHCYGLDDFCKGTEGSCCGDKSCIMNGGHKDKVCTYCREILIRNKNRF